MVDWIHNYLVRGIPSDSCNRHWNFARGHHVWKRLKYKPLILVGT